MKKLLFFPMSILAIFVLVSCEKDKMETFTYSDDNVELRTLH